MPRLRRSTLPDGPFHVIANAVAGDPLFHDDVDRRLYLSLLQTAVETYRWKLLTFALMTTHIHLLVVARAPDLSGGLWTIHSPYARQFQRRHAPRRGHVFDARPRTLPIRTERHLFAALRYIANNPVKSGLCSRPEDYRWSAHRAIVGLPPSMPLIDPRHVFEWFSGDAESARASYVSLVTGDPPPEEEKVRLWAEGPPPDRPALNQILAGADEVEAARLAHLRWGYGVRAIASHQGVSPSTVSRRIRSVQ